MLTMKPWYQSKTVWGGLLAVAAPLLRYGGLEVDAEAQGQLADMAVTIAGSIGGLLAIYGRISAKSGIAGH
ncbi:hypothetical protein ACQQ2Q_02060 [Agrobacterium sp. ES01]|uniref:hypothetical protein n=1 Tax=Agrobacterium sp. ES01 TaxID=3420714 RepID=UPI003D1191BA